VGEAQNIFWGEVGIGLPHKRPWPASHQDTDLALNRRREVALRLSNSPFEDLDTEHSHHGRTLDGTALMAQFEEA
jgi:hypothetical protein